MQATNKQGSNALLISAKEHHHAVSMYLVEQGIEVDRPNMIGITPLFWAADSGDLELCEVLVAKDAHINRMIEGRGKQLTWSQLLSGARRCSGQYAHSI